MVKRDKYIVIEGHDGTGKTTQANRLQYYLESYGKKVIQTKEPGGSPVTEKIRSILKDSSLERTPMTNLLLFTASRIETWETVIAPSLKLGKWVISARNWWSTLAYQGYGEGIDRGVISEITQKYTNDQYVSPDYGFILHHDASEELKYRIASRKEETNTPDNFETKDNEFQQRVQRGYLKIAHDFHIPLIDASKSIHEVQRNIQTYLTLDI